MSLTQKLKARVVEAWKAVIAFLVPLVLAVVNDLGNIVAEDEATPTWVGTLVLGVVSAIAVYWAPNRTPEVPTETPS